MGLPFRNTSYASYLVSFASLVLFIAFIRAKEYQCDLTGSLSLASAIPVVSRPLPITWVDQRSTPSLTIVNRPIPTKLMGAEEEIPHTPPPNPTQNEPLTPRTIRIGDRNLGAVRRGEMDARDALLKSQKAWDGAYAEIEVLRMENKARERADELDRAVRSKTRKVSFPTGGFLDPVYQQTHAEELAARARREKEKTKAKKRATGAVSVPEPSNLVLGQAGLSRIDL